MCVGTAIEIVGKTVCLELNPKSNLSTNTFTCLYKCGGPSCVWIQSVTEVYSGPCMVTFNISYLKRMVFNTLYVHDTNNFYN